MQLAAITARREISYPDQANVRPICKFDSAWFVAGIVVNLVLCSLFCGCATLPRVPARDRFTRRREISGNHLPVTTVGDSSTPIPNVPETETESIAESKVFHFEDSGDSQIQYTLGDEIASPFNPITHPAADDSEWSGQTEWTSQEVWTNQEEWAVPFSVPFSRRMRRVAFLPGDIYWDLHSDVDFFLSPDHLPLTLTGLGFAAVLANTDLDREILDSIQTNINPTRSRGLYQLISDFKFVGNGYVLLPVYAGSAVLGRYFAYDHPFAGRVGEWGERSVRGILVGTPTLLISQWVLGSSRPDESIEGSEWQFFSDDNGVSGHAFMGAVPFLTAMHQSRDPRWKATFFVLSTLPGVSRMTENAHYPSQVFLGWGLAWLVTRAVDDTERSTMRKWTLSPILGPDRLGFGATRRF